MEEDWHVDPKTGILVYAFDLTSDTHPPYTMMHVIMDVVRNNPPRHQRAPGQHSTSAKEAHRSAIHQLLKRPYTVVSHTVLDRAFLESDLARIEARRGLYHDGREPN
jgi:hypothetical protein